jgi:hypothetical protein
MKDRVIQILLSIILTLVGLVIALTFSIEQPHYIGENYAILFVGLLNALWLIPYSVYYFRRGKIRNVRLSIFIYFIFISPFVVYRIYKNPFVSEQWKSELNPYKIYDKYPAHINGDMVADIISSKILIGLPIENIEKLLGNNYYITTYERDTTLWYFYSNKNIFDGCDKLYVTMNNGQCIKADFGGCD